MQLQHGHLTHIIWAGDFNARVGNAVHSRAADTTCNARGRALLEHMGEWGYHLLPWNSTTVTPEGTYRSPSGSYSTVDHLWSIQMPSPHAGIDVHCHHWHCIPPPSPHAILRYSITGISSSSSHPATAPLAQAAAPTYSTPVRVRLT